MNSRAWPSRSVRGSLSGPSVYVVGTGMYPPGQQDLREGNTSGPTTILC